MIYWILILWGFVSLPLLVVADDNCDKAKEYYRDGVKLQYLDDRKAAFEKAVGLCPSYAEAHVNLADALEHLSLLKRSRSNVENIKDRNKLLDDAAKHYSIALKLNPELLVAYIGLGDVYMTQGRYPLAIESYKKFLKSRPGTHAVEERLKQAERLALPDTSGIRPASQIKSQDNPDRGNR